jgi:hypothetical protein
VGVAADRPLDLSVVEDLGALRLDRGETVAGDLDVLLIRLVGGFFIEQVGEFLGVFVVLAAEPCVTLAFNDPSLRGHQLKLSCLAFRIEEQIIS